MVADTLTGDLLFFENGSAINTWSEEAVFQGVSEGAVHKFSVAKVEPLVQEHRSFQEALGSGDSSLIVSIDEGLRVLQVAEQILD
jgi:hypothetical protein